MFGTFTAHVIGLFTQKRRNQTTWKAVLFGPNTLLPTKRDGQEFVGTMKWFVGRGPRPTNHFIVPTNSCPSRLVGSSVFGPNRTAFQVVWLRRFCVNSPITCAVKVPNMIMAAKRWTYPAVSNPPSRRENLDAQGCLLYTSDAADEEDSVDLG